MKKIWTILRTIKFVFRAAPKTMMGILFITFLIGLIIPLNTIIWSEFVNVIIEAEQSGQIRNVVIVLTITWGMWILQTILNKVNRYLKDMQSDYLNCSITDKVFSKLDKLKMEEFDKPDIYNKLNKINAEALGRSVSIMNNTVILIQNIVTFCGAAGILLAYNPILLLLLCIVFIPILTIDIKISSALYSIYNSRLEKLRFISGLKNMMLKYENIKEIKIYNLTSTLVNRIVNAYSQYLREDKEIRKRNTKQQIVSEGGEYIAKFVFAIYIVVDCLKKKKEIGSIILYINAVDILMQNIAEIEYTFSELFNDNLYMEDIFEYLDYVESSDDQSGSEEVIEINNIELKHVYFRYPNSDYYILEDVNLFINTEKTYLIAGLNGAGKTTLIKLLCGLYRPTQGTILVNGKDICECNIKQYQKRLGVVFQDFIHYPMTVEENIKIGDIENFDDDIKMKDVATSINIDSFIKKLPYKYKTQLQNEWDDGVELSIGQWQKIAIARGLFSDADIMILDEPTASLDSISEDEILKSIEKILSKKSCIIISHRYSTAKMVDEIIVVDQKRIVEQGHFDDLIDKQGLFYQLFSLQAEKYKKKEKNE